MPNLAHRMITDLLDDDLEMLHNGDIAPRSISLFYDPEANLEVMDALSRIETRMIEILDPDNVYAESRRVMPLLDRHPIMLTPKSLIIVLQYTGAGQRVLELDLDQKGARLHFHKK